ncbi:alginate O-acetyltransferase AlgX-related protein [Nakamurella leprariae]|uniref:AlgX/AlgJ SGNH hydrolase-like domain-containing protein n=1 Tax=Nakamurella leprariae TaxID=2803911 RepID=A0A938Y8D3_9ACTN|nr:hypothetical protein [Nakamurella leprariae]MBM9467715.1 hypothetical protein [Nakamurella leprariae]
MNEPARDPRFAPARRGAPARKVLRSVAVILGVLMFAVMTWGLPALYHQRYDPTNRPATAAAAEPPAEPAPTPEPADPAWHPVPSADQDRIYQDQTQTAAEHPGIAVDGRDGYVFFGDIIEQNFAQAMGRRYLGRAEVAATVDTLAAERSWLDERGIPNVFVVVPATWSVYQDKMPAWTDGQVLPRIADQLLTADPEAFLDLRQALTEARSFADTYPRLNSHWTPFGATVGLRTVLERLAAEYPALGDLQLPEVTGTRTVDASNEFEPLIGPRGPNDWVLPEFARPLPEFELTGADGASASVPGDTVIDPIQFPARTANPQAGNAHRALILGDSATGVMSPYLAASFGDTWLVRHHWNEPEQRPNVPALIEAYQPDVVITLVTERYLTVPTGDQALYEGAAAFHAPGARPIGGWNAQGEDADGGAIAVESRDLNAPVTARLPELPGAPAAARIELVTDDYGVLIATVPTAAGPVATRLHLAAGRNIVFLPLPADPSGPDVVLQRFGGQGGATLEDIQVRTQA